MPGGTTKIQYAVPVGHVLILKDVRMYSGAPGPAGIIEQYFRSAAGVLIKLKNFELLENGFDAWSGWLVLNATDELVADPQPGSTNYWISGALLPDSVLA